MILSDNSNSFETSLKTKNEFRIKTTAKAFKILSDGLYSNKIKSIIRELSCNAYDSHIASNKKEIPFYVKFPTIIDNTFMVQDFGIGLSNEDINDLYTTYFESSKNNSNDYIGALGLGSKSPFSYTDTFNVISIHNNTKSFYCASLINGIPNIILINEETTEEQNGMSIYFNVKQEDFNNFEKYGKEVFETFEIRPNTNINFDYSYYDNSLFLKFDNYVFREIHNNKIIAIQGNVCYEINKDLITLPEKLRKLTYYDNKCYLEIKFNIGDLEVSASRESLSFDERTIENINNKLKYLDEILQQRLFETINESGYLLQLLNKLNILLDYNGVFKNYVDENNIIYKNEKINLNEKIEIILNNKNKGELKLYKKGINKKCLSRFGKSIEISSFVELKKDKFCILYRDKSRNIKTALLNLLTKYENVFLYDGNKEFLNILEEKLCGKSLSLEEKINVFDLSSFKIDNNSNNKVYESSAIAEYCDHNFYSIENQITLPIGKKYYVKIYGKIPVQSFEDIDKKFFIEDLKIIYKELFKTEIKTIYGIRKSIIKEIEKDQEWINLYDLVFKEIKNYPFKEIIKYENNLNLTENMKNFFKLISENSNNKSFKVFKNTIDKISNINSEDKKYIMNYDLFLKSIKNVTKNDDIYNKYVKTKDIKKYYDIITKKYPLIKMYIDNCLNSYSVKYEYKDFTNKNNIYIKDLLNYVNIKQKGFSDEN